MSARRPWSLLPGRSSFPAFLLTLIGGIAIAAVAAVSLPDALHAYGTCAGAAACHDRPFWGFSPELYLLACAVGLASGAAVAAIGTLGSFGRLDPRRSGYLVVALSAIGAVAYAGYGVGAAAGIAGGFLLVAARGGRSVSPSEWSGSFPAGVPPAPRPTGRAMPPRPAVTEWAGVLAATPTAPPGGGRARMNLPQADRLAAALAKNRTSPPASSAEAPVPVVVLPPPPLGLRAYPGAGPVPPPARLEEAGPKGGGSVPPPVPGLPPRAWKPEASDLDPARANEPGPADAATAELRPTAAPVRPPTVRPSAAALGPLRAPLRSTPRPSPPPEPVRPPPADEPVADRPMLPASRSSDAPPHRGSRDVVRPLPPRTPPRGPPVQVAPPAPTPAPSREVLPVPPPPTAPVASPPRPPSEAGRTPPAGVPPTKGPSRAWKCQNCGLVNAPWSPRCTRCKTNGPWG